MIQRYLPKKLSEAETRALVAQTIAALGITSQKDLGQLMRAVLGEHEGQVDGKLVQRIASELVG